MAVQTDMLSGPVWPERLQDELRQIAAAYCRRERAGHTLQPTAIVSEVWLRLLSDGELGFEDRNHFLALAATTIRRILVDHARKAGALKRGGGKPGSLEAMGSATAHEDPAKLLELDEALEELSGVHPRSARVVELRFFGGMQGDSIAELLGVTERTIRNDWIVARAWLRQRLTEGKP